MRPGWNAKPLSDVAQFINGLWKGEAPPFVHVGVIRNTNFTKDGQLDDTDIAYIDVETKKFQKRRLQPGDLILEKSGGGPKQPVGRVVFFNKTDGEYSFSNFTAAIRVKDPMGLDSRFLYLYLHWVYLSGRTEAMQSHSTGIRNLNGDAYKAIEVVYPSLAEQRRIVAILDEAFEGIATAKAHAEKNLRNAREVFEARIRDIFSSPPNGWVECALGDVCEMYQPKTITGKELVTDGPYLVFGANGPIGRYTTYNHEDPEVLVTCRGATCGAVNVSEPKSWVTGNAMVVRPLNGGLDKSFLEHMLRSGVDLSSTITGAAQPQITRTNLAPLLIRFPRELAVQRQLAAEFGELHEATVDLQTVCQSKLAALDELKQSLLHQAFSGQL